MIGACSQCAYDRKLQVTRIAELSKLFRLAASKMTFGIHRRLMAGEGNATEGLEKL